MQKIKSSSPTERKVSWSTVFNVSRKMTKPDPSIWGLNHLVPLVLPLLQFNVLMIEDQQLSINFFCFTFLNVYLAPHVGAISGGHTGLYPYINDFFGYSVWQSLFRPRLSANPRHFHWSILSLNLGRRMFNLDIIHCMNSRSSWRWPKFWSKCP